MNLKRDQQTTDYRALGFVDFGERIKSMMASDVLGPAPLGAVLYDDSLEGGALLARIAERLAADGLKLAGILGVLRLNLDACTQFASDCFVALPTDIDEIATWCA